MCNENNTFYDGFITATSIKFIDKRFINFELRTGKTYKSPLKKLVHFLEESNENTPLVKQLVEIINETGSRLDKLL